MIHNFLGFPWSPEILPFSTKTAVKSVPLPLVQAQPRSQKTKQNGGSTPAPCLDKPMLVRNTHGSKAGIAMLAMADNHIKTNSMGLQCVVQCCHEQNAQSQTLMNSPFPLQVCHKHPNRHLGPQKTVVPKNPENSGSTPTPCLDKPVLAQGGGLGGGGGGAGNAKLKRIAF